MTVLLSVALLSAAGWLVSLMFPRSAARRHLILTATLAACLALPVVMSVRSNTGWTLAALPGSAFSDEMTGPQAVAPQIDPSAHQADHTRDSVTAHAPAPSHQGAFAAVGNQPASQAIAPTSVQSALSSDGNGALAGNTPSTELRDSSATWLNTSMRVGIALYLIVTVALLLRLFIGLLAIPRLTRRAVEIERLANGVRVVEADVAVPLACGFGKPTIVLPRGFRRALDTDQLQGVYVHESEHLRRRDHWVMMLQGIATAVYWPIVTIHLVNRALTRAREELCDNGVLRVQDPTAYGQTLLSIAGLVHTRRSFAGGLAPTVIRRGELERRVAQLLDKSRDRRTAVSPQVRWTAVACLLALATLLATTRVIAIAQQAPSDLPSKEESEHEPSRSTEQITWTDIPTVDLDNPALHRGVVLGPDDKPLAGASVYAASSIKLLELAQADKVGPNDLGPVRAVTDAEGRFQFTADDLSWVTPAGVRKRWETLLVATKGGLAPGWLKTWGEDRSFRSHWNPGKGVEVAVRMRPTATLTGKLSLEGGGPLAGAKVRLTGLMAPRYYDLDRHIPKEEVNAQGLFQGTDYAETLYRPSVILGLRTDATADAEGRFELPGLPEGYIAAIEATHPEAVTTTLNVAIRAIEPVYRKAFLGQNEPTPSLYGSGFSAELAKGAVLRGQVVFGFLPSGPAPGVTVALANHNSPTGIDGQEFKTDAEGRFEMTGLPSLPAGYDLAFVGSFEAPFGGRRQRVVAGQDARVELQRAIPYRLKLTDPSGKPVDRTVYSIEVQSTVGGSRQDVKRHFDNPRRVGPGLYEGIVPVGPAAVLVERGAKTDRPAAVHPKEFFAPGRTDWTLEEERYAYGDEWQITQPAILNSNLAVGRNWQHDQLNLAATVFTNTLETDQVLELSATVESDPPVTVTLVDDTGEPVEGASVERQLKRYNGEGLPSTFSVYGLHPQRAEFMRFEHRERKLIGTLTTTWREGPISIVMRPAATLFGRFTKKSGKPDSDFGARVHGAGVMPDTFVAGRAWQPTEKRGERAGEFRLVVPPDLELQGDFVRKNDWIIRPTVGVAFGPITPAPGATIELGDLVVP